MNSTNANQRHLGETWDVLETSKISEIHHRGHGSSQASVSAFFDGLQQQTPRWEERTQKEDNKTIGHLGYRSARRILHG
jgi:hypothetical protein